MPKLKNTINKLQIKNQTYVIGQRHFESTTISGVISEAFNDASFDREIAFATVSNYGNITVIGDGLVYDYNGVLLGQDFIVLIAEKTYKAIWRDYSYYLSVDGAAYYLNFGDKQFDGYTAWGREESLGIIYIPTTELANERTQNIDIYTENEQGELVLKESNVRTTMTRFKTTVLTGFHWFEISKDIEPYASSIIYLNRNSGLASTNVQDAIDEIVADQKLKVHYYQSSISELGVITDNFGFSSIEEVAEKDVIIWENMEQIDPLHAGTYIFRRTCDTNNYRRDNRHIFFECVYYSMGYHGRPASYLISLEIVNTFSSNELNTQLGVKELLNTSTAMADMIGYYSYDGGTPINNVAEALTRLFSKVNVLPSTDEVIDLIDDAKTEIYERMEGKKNTFIVDSTMTIATLKGWLSQPVGASLIVENGSGVDIKQDILNGDYDNNTYINTAFNSNNEQILEANNNFIIAIKPTNSPATIGPQSQTYIVSIISSLIDVGDIILVLDKDVPDRWYAGYGLGFHALETEKIDLSANNVSYNNSNSGLSATNIQEAIDELNEKDLKIFEYTGLEPGSGRGTVFSSFEEAQEYDYIVWHNNENIVKGNYTIHAGIYLLQKACEQNSELKHIAFTCIYYAESRHGGRPYSGFLSFIFFYPYTNSPFFQETGFREILFKNVATASDITYYRTGGIGNVYQGLDALFDNYDNLPNIPKCEDTAGTFVLKCINGNYVWVREE